jgi:UDP-N-acetylglucosamine--N-acetylmuramyl-(pentapeptide) pyrophosphoryl-undecaprenol N-acetylglucosamine transferase
MRVLLTGGGTAGHINPALAIAETILRNSPGSTVEFVGVAGGKEDELVPRAGYKLHHVKSTAVQGSHGIGRIKSLALAATSPYFPSTVSVIKKFKPDIVIGTGGYACWPIMAAAARMGIPTALHESNAHPGMAIRRLQSKVDRIWINFPETASAFGNSPKVVCVGNPILQDFSTVDYNEARAKLGIAPSQKLILSFGGSNGAEKVNNAAIDFMKTTVASDPSILHLHASGKINYEDAKKQFTEAGLDKAENCILRPYIYDMPLQMAAADVVIARAGAMTLSELALMKKACILIPSPNVAENHQYKNAKTLADAGAAILVEETELREGRLTAAVRELLASDAHRREQQSKIASFAREDACNRIWQDILKLTSKR